MQTQCGTGNPRSTTVRHLPCPKPPREPQFTSVCLAQNPALDLRDIFNSHDLPWRKRLGYQAGKNQSASVKSQIQAAKPGWKTFQGQIPRHHHNRGGFQNQEPAGQLGFKIAYQGYSHPSRSHNCTRIHKGGIHPSRSQRCRSLRLWKLFPHQLPGGTAVP